MTANSLSPLMSEIVDLISGAVNMSHLKKETVAPETPLMGGGLGLDSIDILEVVIALEKRYGVKIENTDEGRKIFANIGALSAFIGSHSSQSA